MYFSDVFPFSLHSVQEFYTRYFNPVLSSGNAFTYTKKASGSVKP